MGPAPFPCAFNNILTSASLSLRTVPSQASQCIRTLIPCILSSSPVESNQVVPAGDKAFETLGCERPLWQSDTPFNIQCVRLEEQSGGTSLLIAVVKWPSPNHDIQTGHLVRCQIGGRV